MIRPIIFNTEMVTAILEDRKTETRRLIKFPKNNYTGEFPKADNTKVYKNTIFSKKISFYEEPHYCFDMKPPFYQDDILYVRETWAFQCCIECMNTREDDSCMSGKTPTVHEDKDTVSEGCYIYRAAHPHSKRVNWRPSIHMPKEAARIWLKVTEVRAERLKDITHVDIIMEGVMPEYLNSRSGEKARDDFIRLWNSTVKKSELEICGWDANPWVWVINFERIEKPEGWCI